MVKSEPAVKFVDSLKVILPGISISKRCTYDFNRE